MAIVKDFTVIRVGTDSSGRGVYMTKYMQSVWQTILADPRVKPFASKLVIVQGAFMVRNGGGAAASDGYHDAGGCVDVRTRNLTAAELETFIRVAAMNGWRFWRRDKTAAHGGMDPHAHGVLGSDKPLSPGASRQWAEYLNGGDGIKGDRPDYEWRPTPLVHFPPTPKAPTVSKPKPDPRVTAIRKAWFNHHTVDVAAVAELRKAGVKAPAACAKAVATIETAMAELYAALN